MTPDLLAGQVAVVTGASSGIGRAIALALAEAGADCFITARSSQSGAEETAEMIRKLGRQAEVLMIDLAEHDRLDALIDAAFAWQGRVSIWVNNAGVDTLTGAARKWSYEQKLAALLSVDVTASLLLSRRVALRMKDASGGSIVNIGWDQAMTGMAGESGELFAAAKGAIMCMTRSLALSFGPEVRVNCVAPGWIKTAWGETAPQSWQDRAIREAALQRWGEPDDIAGAVRFLVSPEAGFITGQVLPVNGGFRASK
jgi:3-oxoacyl-[acyl-carrier protein] reductase